MTLFWLMPVRSKVFVLQFSMAQDKLNFYFVATYFVGAEEFIKTVFAWDSRLVVVEFKKCPSEIIYVKVCGIFVTFLRLGTKLTEAWDRNLPTGIK